MAQKVTQVVQDGEGGYEPVNRENPLPISVFGPLSAFGELLTATNIPIIQLDFPHVRPPRTTAIGTGSGTSGRIAATGMLTVTTGTTSGSLGLFRSDRALVYRPGQGSMARFTGMFTTGVADSFQRVGLITPTDGLGFGYDGASFGVMHRHGGENEIRLLTISSAASGGENATVTVDGTAHVVALTGGGTVNDDAHEIAMFLETNDILSGFQQIDDGVLYVDELAGANVDTFAYSSATSAGSWATVTTGIDATDDWIPQASWNENAAVILDPTKLNVYQVSYQYLGAGAMFFEIENPEDGLFILVHTIKYANTSIVPSLRNPNLKLSAVARSVGSTTDLSVSTASMAAFHQGEDIQTGSAHTHQTSTTSTTTDAAVLTIKGRLEAGGRASHGELRLEKISVGTESTKGAVFSISIGATLGGNPDCQYIDETGSLALFDESGTTVTGGRLIEVVRVGGNGAATVDVSGLNEYILANETITVAAHLTSGSPSEVDVALTWLESI